MGVEGIGARVPRKEDKRFITGKGRYTDDMSVAGMCHAAFVRSPHAHAKFATSRGFFGLGRIAVVFKFAERITTSMFEG